jgi:hypothetical protein
VGGGGSASIGSARCSGLSGEERGGVVAWEREDFCLCSCSLRDGVDGAGECVTRACRRANAAGSTSAP